MKYRFAYLALWFGFLTPGFGQAVNPIGNQPVTFDELWIVDCVAMQGGQTEFLKAIGGGSNPPEMPVSRLRLTIRNYLRLENENYMVGVFEPGGFINGSAFPMIVALFKNDAHFELVQWAKFDVSASIGASFIQPFQLFPVLPNSPPDPPAGKTANLVLICQHPRSLTGQLHFYKILLSKDKISLVSETSEWKN